MVNYIKITKDVFRNFLFNVDIDVSDIRLASHNCGDPLCSGKKFEEFGDRTLCEYEKFEQKNIYNI